MSGLLFWTPSRICISILNYNISLATIHNYRCIQHVDLITSISNITSFAWNVTALTNSNFKHIFHLASLSLIPRYWPSLSLTSQFFNCMQKFVMSVRLSWEVGFKKPKTILLAVTPRWFLGEITFTISIFSMNVYLDVFVFVHIL